MCADHVMVHVRGWVGAKKTFIFAKRWLPVLSWTCHALKALVKPFFHTHILCFPQVFGSYSHTPTEKCGHLLVPGQNMICGISRVSATHTVAAAFQLHEALPKPSSLALPGAPPGDVQMIWNVLPPVWGLASALLFRSLLNEKFIKWAVYGGVSFQNLILELFGLVRLRLVFLFWFAVVVLFYYFFKISAVLYEHLGKQKTQLQKSLAYCIEMQLVYN